MKKIVITGALGHIGSQAMRSLPMQFPDCEIILIDNLSTLRYCSLFNLPQQCRYQFFDADVLEMDLMPAFEGASCVINLAAITDAAGSVGQRELVEHNNYNATRRVSDACIMAGVPMIHLSSTSVYGLQEGLVDESCSEDMLKPQSPYAETKLKEEKLLSMQRAEKGLDYVILRFGTIAGVSPGMRFHTAVNKFCWQAVLGQPITVWSTALHQYRPYLSLDDAMEAFKFVISEALFSGEIYNVLTDNLTVNDIVESIRKYIPDLSIQYVDEAIMNQLSYEVCKKKFIGKGFAYTGDLNKNIKETIRLLNRSGGRAANGV